MSTAGKIVIAVFISFLLLVTAYLQRRHLPGFSTAHHGQIMVVTLDDDSLGVSLPMNWTEGPKTVFTGHYDKTYLYDKQIHVVWEGLAFFREGTPCEGRVETIFNLTPSEVQNLHIEFQSPEDLAKALQHKMKVAARVLSYSVTLEDCLQNISEYRDLCLPDEKNAKEFVQTLEELLPNGVQIWSSSIRGFDPLPPFHNLRQRKVEAELELQRAKEDLRQAEQRQRELADPLRE